MQTKTSYRPNYKSTLSPFHQQMQDKIFNYSDPKHPVYQEIQKNVGSFDFTVAIQQDTQTLARFKHIRGLVAFLCILKRGDKIVGEGRGTAVISQTNRYTDKVIRYASNASIIDAVVRAAKTLNTLQVEATKPKGSLVPIEELYERKDKITENITGKQKSYLLELVNLNVKSEDERNKWESSLCDFRSHCKI